MKFFVQIRLPFIRSRLPYHCFHVRYHGVGLSLCLSSTELSRTSGSDPAYWAPISPFPSDHPPSSLIRPAYFVLFVPSTLWPGYLDTGDCLMHAHATPYTALFRLTCINKAFDWQHPRPPPSKPLAESWPAYDELERPIPAPASTKSVHFDFRPSPSRTLFDFQGLV
jgi:hypothetical protein